MIRASHKILYLIVVLGLLSQVDSPAQEHLARQLDYADNLFKSELYFDAVTEYKRLLFFDKYRTYTQLANFKIGMCYKYGAKYDNAISYFKRAEISAQSEEDIYSAKIQIVRCNILRRTINNAHKLLDELESDIRFKPKSEDILYWRGWSYMLADDWQKAAEAFSQLNNDHPLRKLAIQVENEKYSVTFAKVISYILPGAGQIYTGNYLSGVMSLGWNALFGYLTINAFIEDRVFDGLVIGNLLWLRFYRGNYENAGKFAINENIKIANDAYRFLKNNYGGEKP